MKLLYLYYLATPLFLLMEALFGMNVRVSIPGDSDALYYLYLAICFACGIGFRNAPFKAALFALFESAVNIFLLVLSVMLPIFYAPATAESGMNFNFGLQELIHFLIAGAILLIGFQQNPLFKKSFSQSQK